MWKSAFNCALIVTSWFLIGFVLFDIISKAGFLSNDIFGNITVLLVHGVLSFFFTLTGAVVGRKMRGTRKGEWAGALIGVIIYPITLYSFFTVLINYSI